MKQYQGLKIGKKYTKLPIIQGGMGIGISLADLSSSAPSSRGVCRLRSTSRQIKINPSTKSRKTRT